MQKHDVIRAVAVAWMAFATVSHAADGYIAAVGVGTNANRYLKVARICDLGGTPIATQAQADISGDFQIVEDVAFLRNTNDDRLVAVLGDCRDFVPAEDYEYWAGWGGYNHYLEGKVAIYRATASGDVSLSGPIHTVAFTNLVANTRRTESYQQRGRQHGETWRLAGLAAGGFAVNASDVPRTGARWQPDRDHPYNWLLVFDRTYAFQFRADMWLGWSDGGRNDVAGFVNPFRDAVASTWAGVSGTPTGVLRQYLINWDSGTLTETANLVGATDWCYYMHNVAPLAYVGETHALSGGVTVRDGSIACNVARDFTSGILNSARGWGRAGVTGGSEAMGLNSDGVNLMVAFRCTNGTNRLYRVATTNGAYTDTGFSFVWGGESWTVTASDGDAMAMSVIAPTLEIAKAEPSPLVTWHSFSGQSYQPEVSTNLVVNDWQPWGNPIHGTNGEVGVELPATKGPPLFMRVKTERE